MIERLLGDISPSTFAERYFLKFPLVRAGGASSFANLGSWDTVRAILTESGVDVMVVRDGALVKHTAAPTYDEAREMHAAGCTLVIRNSERHYEPLNQLAAGFRQAFMAAVDIHIYCTPPGHAGFGWHYDAEDVFILQTQGSKEYSLRKNTVHPWPLVETIPSDMQYEREIMPLMRCTLAAGDWLYIPTGYWHKAQAADPRQESISLAIGVMSTAAVDVFDFLRPRLLSSLLWRQRLPAPGLTSTPHSQELMNEYRCIFRQLADDLVQTICDERLVQDFLLSRVGNLECGDSSPLSPNATESGDESPHSKAALDLGLPNAHYRHQADS